MNKPKVFVIAGAAGSGKTTVANYLQDHFQMHKVITHTTRAPRPGEQDGIDYHFETSTSMKQLHLLESVEYDHHLYGSSLEGLEEGWSAGQNDVIVLDTKGAATYARQLGSRVVVIFLTVSKLTVLGQRMQKRGDRLSEIRSRVHSREYQRDLRLPTYLKGIAHVIVNDRWPQTKQAVNQIVSNAMSE